MTKAKAGRSPTARPARRKRLKYEAVRDLFLAEAPETDEEALDFFVQLGMYIHGRWEAIAADADGQPLDEDNSNRWDECTEGEFDQIRAKAEELVDREVARRRVTAFLSSVVKDPWGTVLRKITWVVMTAWEHFVGAIGLVAFGLLILWLVPHIVQDIRSAVDELLPANTRPPELQNAATQNAAQNTADGTVNRH